MHISEINPTQLFQFISVQLLGHVQLFVTPWTAAHQPPCLYCQLSEVTQLMPIESVMPSNHLILCHTLLLLPSIFPRITFFSNGSVLHIRWPTYWTFNVSPFNEYSGLISFRMDWLDLLVVQGFLKSLLQHHSSKASILWHSAIFIVQISYPYMTIWKTIALIRRTIVGKLISLLFNMLSKLVITLFPRSNHLLISWLQSPSAVILELCHCFHCFPIYLPWSDRTRRHGLSFLNVELEANFFTLLLPFHQEAF